MDKIIQALTHSDPNWALRFLSKSEMDAMDAALVRAGHPLAFEPGTQEGRFLALHRNGYRFSP